jgi:hypothetical protein
MTTSISDRAAAAIQPPPGAGSTVPIMPRAAVVDEDRVHGAMDYLRETVGKLGKARERARLAENMIKHVEALEFKLSDAKTEAGKKADARTSQRFLDAIAEDAVACGELTKLYAAREAASTVVEAWRTQSATLRSATKL